MTVERLNQLAFNPSLVSGAYTHANVFFIV